MKRLSHAALLAALLAFGARGSAQAAADAAAKAMAQAAGCESGTEASTEVGGWPGDGSGAKVFASIPGALDSNEVVGPLCLAVLQPRTGGGYARAAGLAPSAQVTVEAEVTPLGDTSVSFDKLAFRFRPDETALGVRMGGYYDSTAVSTGFEDLLLFRRVGGRLSLIFQAHVEDSDTDKSTGEMTGHSWIVRFAPRTTNGAFDLILSRKGARAGRRYVWDGARYVAARG